MPMPGKIQVLIADDVPATRENIRKLLAFNPEFTVVGEAETSPEAIALAKQLQPDIVLMDVNMPGMDGITAAETLSTEVPRANIIIMSVQGEKEYLRRAMAAGAKDYLVKPFTGEELVQAIRQTYDKSLQRQRGLKRELIASQPGKVIVVFSTKGGIGKTTIATNLAVALAQVTGQGVGVIDADLQFGDVSLFLNILPQATIYDLVQVIEQLDAKLLIEYLTAYNDQVKVLPAPLRPEQAEAITGSHLSAIIKLMRQQFAYTIIDTAPSFNDPMLAVLDAADTVLMVAALDLPTVKNVKLGLEIMENLHYGRDKIKLILNCINADGVMEVKDVEASLHYSFTATLPSDSKTVVTAANCGVPFVLSNPQTPVAKEMFGLARTVAGVVEERATALPMGVVGRLKHLFS